MIQTKIRQRSIDCNIRDSEKPKKLIGGLMASNRKSEEGVPLTAPSLVIDRSGRASRMSGAPSALRGIRRQGGRNRNNILLLSVVYSLSYEQNRVTCLRTNARGGSSGRLFEDCPETVWPLQPQLS